MVTSRSRRFVVRSVVSLGVISLSGCLFGIGRGPDAGTLVITNGRTERHKIEIRVTKTSEDYEDTRFHDQTPDPETTSIWEREATFSIGADGRVKETDFLTETGAFYIEVELETGEIGSGWLGLYDAARGGVAENALRVDISEGGITVYGAHDD